MNGECHLCKQHDSLSMIRYHSFYIVTNQIICVSFMAYIFWHLLIECYFRRYYYSIMDLTLSLFLLPTWYMNASLHLIIICSFRWVPCFNHYVGHEISDTKYSDYFDQPYFTYCDFERICALKTNNVAALARWSWSSLGKTK